MAEDVTYQCGSPSDLICTLSAAFVYFECSIHHAAVHLQLLSRHPQLTPQFIGLSGHCSHPLLQARLRDLESLKLTILVLLRVCELVLELLHFFLQQTRKCANFNG
jgi:hypothetical protein